MKISNRLNSLSLSFRCFFLAVLCGTTAAAFTPQSDGGGDPGNQDCNSTSAEMVTDSVTAKASRTRWENDNDHWIAESAAIHGVEIKIGEASGIVCKLCENGRRCKRETYLTSGSLVLVYAEIMPEPGVHDGGWICEATWTGKYKIRCEAC